MAVTINIPSQFVVKTEANWTADATVYAANSGLMISSDATYGATDQRKIKIPDGAQTWTNLDYLPIGDGAGDLLAANNLSDVSNASTSFSNIKQAATTSVTGVVEIATQTEVNTGTDTTRSLTPDTLANSTLVTTTVAANTAKVTNATHTSEVTGATSLTINKVAISNKTLVTAAAGDHVLIGDATDSDNLKKVNVSDFLSGGSNTIALPYFHTNGTSLADSADYFIMATTAMGNTNNSTARISIPSGTVIGYDIVSYVGGTFATTENCTVTFEHNDGASSNVLSSAVKFDARNNRYASMALSISVTAGYSWIKLDTPVFVTNPTGAKLYVIIYMDL